MIDETFGIVDFGEAGQSLADDLPASFFVGGVGLPHGPVVHSRENVVGELKDIGEAFLRGLAAGAEDLFAVDGILHGFEFGGVGCGTFHRPRMIGGRPGFQVGLSEKQARLEAWRAGRYGRCMFGNGFQAGRSGR